MVATARRYPHELDEKPLGGARGGSPRPLKFPTSPISLNSVSRDVGKGQHTHRLRRRVRPVDPAAAARPPYSRLRDFELSSYPCPRFYPPVAPVLIRSSLTAHIPFAFCYTSLWVTETPPRSCSPTAMGCAPASFVALRWDDIFGSSRELALDAAVFDATGVHLQQRSAAILRHS